MKISYLLVVGLIVSIACLLLFGKLAEDVSRNEALVEFDLALTESFYRIVTPRQIAVFSIITRFGNEIIFLFAIPVGIVFLARRQRWRLLVWIVALLGGELLSNLLKLVFARPRPPYNELYLPEHTASFPSGHAMMSIIAYGLLAYVLIRWTPNRWLRIVIVFAATLIVVLVGFSRLYLGVHYLSDVLAGLAAGGVWLVVCITAMQRVWGREVKGERTED